MIAVLSYESIFKDIFLREPTKPEDFLDNRLNGEVKDAIKYYDDDKVKSIASVTFETWKDLMDKMSTQEGINELPGSFYLKEIK